MKEFKQKPLKGLEDLADSKYSIKTITALENRRIGGLIGGKKCKELSLGFNTKEMQSKGGKIGGNITGKMSYEQGFGIFSQTKEEIIKNAKLGGKEAIKSPNHPNNIKIKCEYCGKESNIGMIKRWHGENCKHKK
jgi:hypothetical protein